MLAKKKKKKDFEFLKLNDPMRYCKIIFKSGMYINNSDLINREMENIFLTDFYFEWNESKNQIFVRTPNSYYTIYDKENKIYNGKGGEYAKIVKDV